MSKEPVSALLEVISQHSPTFATTDSLKMVCRHPDCHEAAWSNEHVASAISALENLAVIELPSPTVDGLPEWWPDDDESPWSVTVFDGHPRISFDSDDKALWRESSTLQISKEGEYWPFIGLTNERAEMLAAHLLAAVQAARATGDQK